MSDQTWLVIDAPYLCHRAFHSMGNLSYGEAMTGTLFGFLRDIITLKDLFQPDRFVFCFDAGTSKRREMYPKYKRSRRAKERTPEEQELYQQMQKQMRLLRYEILKGLGFSNVFYQIGYEADDIIGHLCWEDHPQIIIVSCDHDLYQLLSPRVSIWNMPKSQMITYESFRDEFKIEPSQWVDVKAIAGCSTDDIQGIKGVGEITACKFLRGDLKQGQKFIAIVEGTNLWERNLNLVRLPLAGLNKDRLQVRKDQVSQAKWIELCNRYGFQSLKGAVRWGRK